MKSETIFLGIAAVGLLWWSGRKSETTPMTNIPPVIGTPDFVPPAIVNTGTGFQPTTPIDFGFGTPAEIQAAEDNLRTSMTGLANLGTYFDTQGIDFAGIQAIQNQGGIKMDQASILANLYK